MKKVGLLGAQFAFPIATAIVLLVCLVAPSRADRRADAGQQFERAVRMRTTLEGYLEKDRALADYKQTIAAYHKVYLLSVTADEVTPSLIAEAELYEEMGRLFDSKYYTSSIETYRFLIKQYPGSRYRGSAMLAIARVQKRDLADLDAAEATYKDYLKLFPRAENAADARAGLKEIAAQRAQIQAPSVTQTPAADRADDQPPVESGARIEPRVNDQRAAVVKDIRAWNSKDSTRVVLTLDDTISFDAARIASPDRIYFDISKARLASNVSKKPLELEAGLLKSVR